VLELEQALVQRYGWSLRELDLTDIESLLPFVFYQGRTAAAPKKITYCDQVDFL
jgi:hypothetical protein